MSGDEAAEDVEAIPDARRRPIRASVLAGLVLTMALGLIGRWTRDPVVPLALLLYLPILPAGLIGLVWDLRARGRALRGVRFGLAGLGLLAVACEAHEMIGGPGAEAASPGGRELTVLHWNVLWGSKRSPSRWGWMCRTILERRPDIVILSEAPIDAWIDPLRAGLGDGATAVGRWNPPGSRDLYGLVVASRWPVAVEEAPPLANGEGMIVRVATPEGDRRILVVDGRSDPLVPRAPFLVDIAATCEARRRDGRPIDLIAGDFNCLARNLGFEEIEAAGYRLASRSCGGWRGTFPSPCPLLDIDHVWVDAHAENLRTEMFANLASDHRGQVVRFRPPADRGPR